MTLHDVARFLAENPTHKEWQKQVTDLLDQLGFRWLHVHTTTGKVNGRRQKMTATSMKGWPDLAPVWRAGHPEMWAIELKVPPDRLSLDQAAVLASLESSGWKCAVVIPGDLQALASALVRRGAGLGELHFAARTSVQPRGVR